MATPEAEGQASLFGDDEVEVVETPETIAGKKASEIFARWYSKWYVGRYTQSPGHIVKVFKNMILVRNIDPYDLEWAANIVGDEQRPVTEPALQLALSKVREYKRRNGGAPTTSTEDTIYVESL